MSTRKSEKTETRLYVSFFKYDNYEDMYVIDFGYDYDKVKESYDKEIEDGLTEGVFDDMTTIELVEMNNTQRVLELIELFTPNDVNGDTRGDGSDLNEFRDNIIEELKFWTPDEDDLCK